MTFESPNVFGGAYASAYQSLYRDKDYAAECDFIEQIFKHAGISARTVLDLGCGTGGHAIVLSERGYKLTGVDRSSDMLGIARQRAKEAGLEIDFQRSAIANFGSDKVFDAVISMFAVMSYQTTNDAVEQACATAFRHLRPGGVFVFDAWHGLGVLEDPPSERIKKVEDQAGRILRFCTPQLDAMRQTVDTRYAVWRVVDGQIVEETEETHQMRFFFTQELAYFLKVAGFANVRFCPCMRPGDRLQSGDWQMAVIATK